MIRTEVRKLCDEFGDDYWRETVINVIAPVSDEMAKNYLGQHVLDLPQSY